MKSNYSMDPPLKFKNGDTWPDVSSVQQKSSNPESSCVSMKSDCSMDPPLKLKSEDTQPDLRSNLLSRPVKNKTVFTPVIQPQDLNESMNPGFSHDSKPAEVLNTLRSNLIKKFECLYEGISKQGNPTLLNEIYTELYMTESESGEISNEHEVRQIETQSRRAETEDTPIKCSDIFRPLPGQDKPIRTVLTKGVAGIGKTVSVQKFILDWAEGKENQDVQLIFPLPFRELNLMKDKTLSLSDLLHVFFPETKEMEISSDRYKVLFIFDGLDEYRLPLDFQSDVRLCDVTESASVDVLLMNLIVGNLLPSALIWIISRPAAADLVPSECVHRVTEVRGFSDPQKEDYFRKRIRDQSLAYRIISHLKSSRSLFIMCHIPVFCWISATVLEKMLRKSWKGEIPKTLTQMYTHFMIIQINIKHEKDYETKVKDEDMIVKLGKLAYQQLVKGNLIFYEEDLRECGIDVTEASVYSGLCSQIFREELGLYQGKVFCFVHLSIQEHLAALYVHLSFINKKINVFDQITKPTNGDKVSLSDLHQRAVDEALDSKNGHLDLFLRFLLGLSVESNQSLLQELKTQTGNRSHNNEKTVDYIKEKISENPSPDKYINLFHCLNELGDLSLVNEAQPYMSSRGLRNVKLSSSQWSALVFVLLTSEETMNEFKLKSLIGAENDHVASVTLKAQNTADEVLQKLLPVVTATRSALLSCSGLTDEGCASLASALRSNPSHLRKLDLSGNNLGDSGVKLLSVLENPHCKLEELRLNDCGITDQGCAALALALRSNPSHIRELNLSENKLQDSGVKLLFAVLENPHCKLETLWLNYCGVTDEGCAALASALRSNPSHLKVLHLSGNNLGQSGVKLLSGLKADPHYKLETLIKGLIKYVFSGNAASPTMVYGIGPCTPDPGKEQSAGTDKVLASMPLPRAEPLNTPPSLILPKSPTWNCDAIICSSIALQVIWTDSAMVLFPRRSRHTLQSEPEPLDMTVAEEDVEPELSELTTPFNPLPAIQRPATPLLAGERSATPTPLPSTCTPQITAHRADTPIPTIHPRVQALVTDSLLKKNILFDQESVEEIKLIRFSCSFIMTDSQGSRDGDFSPECSSVQQKNSNPESSCVSVKSDRSMDPPPKFKSGDKRPDLSFKTVQQKRSKPESSCVSMKSDCSMDPPLNFKSGDTQPDLSHESKPAEVLNTFRSNLRKKFECLYEGISKQGNPTLLNEIYTELYITESESGEISNEHEVRQIETQSRRAETEDTPIKCSDIFRPLPGQDKLIRTVLTKGVAGIGKTVSVQKFILDWAEGKENQDVQLIFPLPFRELNLMKDKTLSLSDLLHVFFPDTKEMEISSDKYKVLFIFDGLDECRLSLDFQSDVKLCDVTESASVDVLLMNLIVGNLLPSALIWITSRPAAADLVPSECVHRVTEVRGFSDPQKEEYFRKRIRDQSLAYRIISHLKSSRSLFIMCQIPVFCWISATVLEKMLSEAERGEIPKTLTQMYTHFLIIQTNIKHEKDYERKEKNEDMIVRLGKLAYQQLVKGNLIFYEEDLTECGIDVTEASVYSGLCSQIFREELGLYQGKVFCFVHLSIQEHLAALYVHLSFINKNINVFDQITKPTNGDKVSLSDLHQRAVDEALDSKNGHLDLFLRFLLGLSMDSNQSLLQELKTQTGNRSHNNKKTVDYIKEKISENPSPDKYINLFHCLNELGDLSLVNEAQPHMSRGRLRGVKLSSSQWSALVFVLLTSEQAMRHFNLNSLFGATDDHDASVTLKAQNTADEVLQKLLPVVTATRSATLSKCGVTDEGCAALASALRSNPSHLRELFLNVNKSGDSGVKLLSVVLDPHCKLDKLGLSNCDVTDEGCAALASALKSNPSQLRELNLSYNNLGDSGVKLLSAVLENPQCKLEKLVLSKCGVTDEGCVALASALRSNPSHLRELNLNRNNLGDLGVKLLSDLKDDPQFKLDTLWTFR
ncbi:uncharacterized protein LOC125248296 [Megalobrama amblycephala]|uniref:uncharacterized protein LOC125248296 n=1 Tax=Megalobrama amblycephala TaxID=75352 RepID=UPI002013CE9A|nr:uncharacterized protein LOC125248296 [Megalobrama amblycephala]